MKNFKYGHPYPYLKLPPPELLGMTTLNMGDMMNSLIEQRRQHRDHLRMTNDEIQEYTSRVIRERAQRSAVERDWENLGHGERRVFRIPVGNIPEGDMDEYVAQIANKFKRHDQPIGNIVPIMPIEHYEFPVNSSNDFLYPIIDYPDLLQPEKRNPLYTPELMDGYWKTLTEMRNPQPKQKKVRLNLAVSNRLRIFVSTIKNIFKWKS